MLEDPRETKSNRQSKKTLQGGLKLFCLITDDVLYRVEVYYQTLNVQSVVQSEKYTVSIVME